jgi:hypothetical protein
MLKLWYLGEGAGVESEDEEVLELMMVWMMELILALE